jgi:hypothetical protein
VEQGMRSAGLIPFAGLTFSIIPGFTIHELSVITFATTKAFTPFQIAQVAQAFFTRVEFLQNKRLIIHSI